MNDEPSQEFIADESAFTGETDESELEALVSKLKTNILIIGSGGAGNNTLTRLYKEGMTAIELLAVNTDAQHLLNTPIPHRMLIGKKLTRGLGAGSEPSTGEGAAEEARPELLQACQDADIVFLTGGLGGGTGTGSLPVIARLAKERGALTIAIVTLPFSNEGARRSKNARLGLDKLRKSADTAFRQADEILGNAIRCMTEITSQGGLVNIDFADMRSIMDGGGVAMIGMGEGQGANRATDAVSAALQSPLLELDIANSEGALVNVTGGDDMTLQEAHEVVREVHSKINKDARIIWGASIDSTLEHQIRVMLVVTGVKSSQILGPPSGVDDGMQNKYGIEFVQ